MAKGDITYSTGNLAAGASVVFQPAAGKRMKISAFTNDNSGYVLLEVTIDGVAFYSVGYPRTLQTGAIVAASSNYVPGFFADNTKYFRLRNTGTAAYTYFIQAIEY